MPHKLQKPPAVLSGRLQYLAEVAQSPNAREGNDVGEVHPTPSSPSLVATVDHASLAMCGESCLGTRCVEICTVGSVRGENVGAATVDLNGHAAGNGRYSQGTPTARWVLLYSDRRLALCARVEKTLSKGSSTLDWIWEIAPVRTAF